MKPESRRRAAKILLALLAVGSLACSDADRTRWSARFGSAESQYVMGERHVTGRGVEADLELALEWFEKAAEQGHLPSQMRLVELYEERDAEGDASRASHWLKAAAEAGGPEAQYRFGRHLADAGESAAGAIWIEKAAEADHPAAQVVLARRLAWEEGGDRAEVIALLKKAALQGDPDGAFELARVAENGVVEMSDEEISKLLLDAAEKDHAGAQFAVAERYARGAGFDEDLETAVSWYRRSAEQGYAPAQEAMGVMFQAGRGVYPSPAEAVRWYRLAADQGRPAAQNQLGLMHAQGLVGDEETADRIEMLTASGGDEEELKKLGAIAQANNDRRAVEWYRIAIEQDFSPAMINLARLIESGRVPDADPDEVIALYRRAAELGNPVGQSQMAVRYSQGKGVDQDATESLAMLEAAARGGHTPAQMSLAAAYLRGIGGEPDQAQAAFWYRTAVEAGVEEAVAPYASMLARGIGVPKDEMAALQLFQKAAEREDATAQYSLGVFHEKGMAGLTADPRTAVMWWRRAANQGQPQAQAKLGIALVRAEGTTRNVTEAYAWLAASGLEETEPWIQVLEEEMPQLMLVRARKLAERRKALRESATADSAEVPTVGE
jgi:TPR repeat protein